MSVNRTLIPSKWLLNTHGSDQEYVNVVCALRNTHNLVFYAMKQRDGDAFYSRMDLRMRHDSFVKDTEKIFHNIYHGNTPVEDEKDHDASSYFLHTLVMFKYLSTNYYVPITKYFIENLFPESVKCQDYRGALPIHIACLYQNWTILPLLIDHYPCCANVIYNGSFPLQISLSNRYIEDILFVDDVSSEAEHALQYLLLANKAALSVPFNPKHPTKDEMSMIGFLPFHMACCQNFSVSVIYLLLRSYPIL